MTSGDETKRGDEPEVIEAEMPGTESTVPGSPASGQPELAESAEEYLSRVQAEEAAAAGLVDAQPLIDRVTTDLLGQVEAAIDAGEDPREVIDLTALIAHAAADEDDDEPEAAELLDPAAFGMAPYDAGKRSWDSDSADGGERIDAEPVDDPFEDVEPTPINPTQQFKRLTPASAQRAAEQRDRGFIFVLYYTPDDQGNPQQMHVRRVSFSDRAMIGSLPNKLQNQIFDMLAKLGDEARNSQQAKRSIQRMMRNLGRGEEIADAYMCAGAIDPPVYLTIEEAERNGGTYVKYIDLNDRQRFMQACDRSTTEAAKALLPFPEGSPVVVAAGEAD